MTPLPRPTPALHRMRPDNPVPMTSAQYLRWLARKSRPPAQLAVPSKEEAAAAIAHLQGMPFWRDLVCATESTVAPATVDTGAMDEVDASYLAAIRLEPAVVGTEPGQVPMEVARRLYAAGLIRKVVGG